MCAERGGGGGAWVLFCAYAQQVLWCAEVPINCSIAGGVCCCISCVCSHVLMCVCVCICSCVYVYVCVYSCAHVLNPHVMVVSHTLMTFFDAHAVFTHAQPRHDLVGHTFFCEQVALTAILLGVPGESAPQQRFGVPNFHQSQSWPPAHAISQSWTLAHAISQSWPPAHAISQSWTLAHAKCLHTPNYNLGRSHTPRILEMCVHSAVGRCACVHSATCVYNLCVYTLLWAGGPHGHPVGSWYGFRGGASLSHQLQCYGGRQKGRGTGGD